MNPIKIISLVVIRPFVAAAIELTILAAIAGSAYAAPHWGDFRAEQCTNMGKRQFSAILWDIPWGQKWETVCAGMQADVIGHHFDRPTRCVTNNYEWGQFDVPDSSCPHWGDFKRDACSAIPGKRQYSAILWDIPAGMSWEQACYQTPATVQGQTFSRPTRCWNQSTAMWGEFDVSDPGCATPPPGTTSHQVSQLCPPGLTCVYRAPRYLNVYWAAPGTWDREISAAGMNATRASLDQFVSDVTRSAYFSGLAQYGVGQPTFAGSVEADPGCLQQFPVPNTADYVHISGFVACQVNAMKLPTTDNLIVNLYLLPRSEPQWVNATVLGQTIKWGGCDAYAGYHSLVPLTLIGRNGAIAPTVPFTVLPLACWGVNRPLGIGNQSPSAKYDQLTETISHEMVEAATDPGMFGWMDHSITLMPPEIGDMCSPNVSTMFPTRPKSFSNGQIDAYWSNSPPGCVFGNAFAKAPMPPLHLPLPPRK